MCSTMGDVQYTGGYHEYSGGYHEYTGDIMINVEKSIGDYSVPLIITQYKGLLLSSRDYCEPIVKR